MQDKHVPDIDPHYWAIMVVATFFGSAAGDFISENLGRGGMHGLDVPLLALGLLTILVVERRDRTPNHIWYWAAITVIPMASDDLAALFATVLQLSRPWVIVGLALGLVVTFLVTRSDAMHVVAMNMMARAKPAVPLTDASYWIGMVTASMLGTVASDLLMYSMKLSALRSSVVLTALLGATFITHRLSGVSRRFVVYWLTVVMINAATTSVGHLLAWDRIMGVGLPLCLAVSGALLVALMAWRRG